uniref:Uncharacterized protein n=1 Tax=Timema bartmani TaxID=61472 RepID=A0A7R9EZ12_9NEOP|nr:unnamed protein product [Timema bartmani]
METCKGQGLLVNGSRCEITQMSDDVSGKNHCRIEDKQVQRKKTPEFNLCDIEEGTEDTKSLTPTQTPTPTPTPTKKFWTRTNKFGIHSNRGNGVRGGGEKELSQYNSQSESQGNFIAANHSLFYLGLLDS